MNEIVSGQKVAHEHLKSLLQEFFYYLDVVEESDSGKEFHPNYISSCRVMDSKAMNEILKELKDLIK